MRGDTVASQDLTELPQETLVAFSHCQIEQWEDHASPDAPLVQRRTLLLLGPVVY